MEVEEFYQELTNCLNTVKLVVAGRMLYYDEKDKVFVLAMHSTSPEKTQEAVSLAWDSIPEDLKAKLKESNIGFAGKQI